MSKASKWANERLKLDSAMPHFEIPATGTRQAIKFKVNRLGGLVINLGEHENWILGSEAVKLADWLQETFKSEQENED